MCAGGKNSSSAQTVLLTMNDRMSELRGGSFGGPPPAAVVGGDVEMGKGPGNGGTFMDAFFAEVRPSFLFSPSRLSFTP